MRHLPAAVYFAPLALFLVRCHLTAAQAAALEDASSQVAQVAACELLPLADPPPGVEALACADAAPIVRAALSAAVASSPTPTSTGPAKKALTKNGRTVAIVPAHLHAGAQAAIK